MKLSQLTKCPLNVSPFLSSTNCKQEVEINVRFDSNSERGQGG